MSDKEDLKLLKKTFEEFIQSSSDLQHSYERLKEKSSQLSLFLSNILDNIPSAIFVINNDFNIILWNQRASSYFKELKDKTTPLPVRLVNVRGEFDLMKLIKSDKESVEIETQIDDEVKWFEIQSGNFINAKSEKIGFIVVINDKTDFKLLQLKSQREDRLRVMGELAAEVAHEIRNPLGSIELMVTLLQEDLEESSKQSDILSRIRSSVNSMNHTVTNILLYTKNIKPKFKKVRLTQLLDEARSLVMMNRVKKGVQVHQSAPDADLFIDLELMKQSIGNILLNAIESVDENGEITIKCEISPDSVTIGITDNGPGIPDHIQEKIFNPFFTTKNTGTGLGLAMVKRVIEAHNGRLEFKSDSNETLFLISIPLK